MTREHWGRLIRRVRAAAPDAYIIYKPHPDVEAGHRRGAITDEVVLALADEVLRDVPISSVIEMVVLLTPTFRGRGSHFNISTDVGGMLVGTLLTLFVVPTAYTLLARRHRTFEERLEQDRAAHVAPAAAD